MPLSTEGVLINRFVLCMVWQHREIARIKRDEEERIRLKREKEETEARRKMTDEERKKDDE